MGSEVRHSHRSPLARLARGLFAACAVALLTLGLVGIWNVEKARRAAQSDTRRLRDYSSLTDLAASQRRRLATSGASAIATSGFRTDARRTIETLRILQRQSDSPEANALTALQVSYAPALQRAASGRDGA